MSCSNSVPVGETCPQCGFLHTAVWHGARVFFAWVVVLGLAAGGVWLIYRRYNGGGYGGYGDYGWR